MDDDLVRRALGTPGRHDPPDAVLERALVLGAARRRRRRAALAGAAGMAIVAAVAGGVLVTGDDDGQIVGVPPGSTTMPPPSIPATSIPATTVTSPAVVTTAAAVPPETSAPVVEPDPTVPPLHCDAAADLTLEAVVLTTDEAPPPRESAFLLRRVDGSVLGRIEVWSADGMAASLADTVEGAPDQWHCPTSLVPMGYDGRYLWATVGGARSCTFCVAPRGSTMLFRADLASGDVDQFWEGLADLQIHDLVPTGDGAALMLHGPRAGSGALEIEQIRTDGAASTILEWPVDTPAVDARIWSPNTDARSVAITYTTGAERSTNPALHVVMDAATMTEYVVDLTDRMISPTILGWSPRSGQPSVLLSESWEGIAATAIVTVDAARPQRSTFTRVGAAACWTDTGVVARATWTGSSETIYGDPGPVELVDPVDLSVIAVLAESTFSGELACLDGQRVALAAFDATELDPATILRSVVPGSERVVLVDPSGTMLLTDDPDLRVVAQNANH